jgi:hypothetical protein
MLNVQDAAVAKAMLSRGDNQHDIAAHFGVNPGRIAEIKSGEKFPEVKAVPLSQIPSSKQPRFVDPKAPAAQQYEQLRSFINQPPEGSRVLIVTPGLAELVLDRLNTNNRKRRPSNIKRFADAMLANNWTLTGDTIKFSRKSGLLLDGQNRLAGCVRSVKAFKTHVVFGIDDDAFSRIDAGATRTNPDTFTIAGVPYPAVTAAAVRWLIIGTDRGRKVENQELLDYYNKHVETDRIEQAVRDAIAVGRVLPPGALAAHFYLFAAKNDRIMIKFATDLIKRRSGGRKLLEKIERLRQQQMRRVNELQINALTIQAWNAYRAGKSLTAAMLNWDENKEFPTIA